MPKKAEFTLMCSYQSKLFK